MWSALIDEVIVAANWLRRARCGAGGHAMMMQFEPGRLSLRCQSCGEQTPGWLIAAHGK
jgi:hypothetical protein